MGPGCTCKIGDNYLTAFYLIMHYDMHDVVVDFSRNAPCRFIWEENVLDAQEWNQNEGGTDSFHIQTRLCMVCYFQFGDEDSYDVQQKEQVHL